VRALEDSPSGAAGFQFDLTKRTGQPTNTMRSNTFELG
jgi:hypothetical protein